MESPFDVLLIDSDADEGEIDRAYRRRVIETHPDQGGSVREFQRVKAAYEEIKSGRRTGANEGGERNVDGRSENGEASAGGEEGGDGRDSADGTGESEKGDSGAEDTEETGTRVEYLNYEVLDDYGWSLDDDDLFEKASDAGLDPDDRGRFLAQPNESLLEAAENCGFRWPYACRGGACANCAVAVAEGEMDMPANHILPAETMGRGIRLSCNGKPATDEMKVVYNVKCQPDLDELRLPPNRFEQAQYND